MMTGLNFGSTPDEIENQRKRLLLYASAALGSTFLSTFCVVSFVQGRTFLASILLFFVGIVVACAYLAKVMVQVQRVCLFLGLVLFFLSSYLLLGGGADGTGAYWSYAVTMLMVLLVGPRIGMLYMALYLLVNSLALSSSLSFVYAYSDISVSRIISTSIILYTLILASEWIRIGSYGAISSASESYRTQANTDPLTHILNRHGVQVTLTQRPLYSSSALVMIDVDHFKNINDAHGHDFGDRVLVSLAESLKKHTKGGDIVGRWGGEEFLVVLFDTSIDSAAELICRIKDNFHSDALSNNAERVPVTFSAGIANLDRVEDFEATVQQADKRLYMAKEQGRNRVVTG